MASLAREGGAPVYKMSAQNGTEVTDSIRLMCVRNEQTLQHVSRICSLLLKACMRLVVHTAWEHVSSVPRSALQLASIPVCHTDLYPALQAPVDGFMIQFNKNAFGLAPGMAAVPLGTIAPGGTADATVPVALSAGQVAPGAAPNMLQVRRFAPRCFGSS